MKRVFSMAIMSTEPEVESVIHAGVTTVMPNLGGILVQTENRDDIQIDSNEMTHGFSTEFLYLSENDIEKGFIRIGSVIYHVIDHRV